MIRNFFLIGILLVGFTFSSTSNALYDWKWVKNKNGNYYTIVRHNTCETGVTVYWRSDERGTGWRVAFDWKDFRNLNREDAEIAMVDAIELYYQDYVHGLKFMVICGG